MGETIEIGNKYKLVPMSAVEERDAEWLVTQYIPKGQITVLAGDGGVGKTTIWCDLAAAVSTGRRVFFDSVPDDFESAEPGKVIFFSAEDSIEITLKSRLRQAGANMDNIFSICLKEKNFSHIKFGGDALQEIVKAEKPALMIFDPIQAFVPSEIQMGSRNAMRNCLSPLIGLGEECGTTFVLIAHTNKKKAVWGRTRIADSSDVWDIARSVLIAGNTMDNGIRYVSHEKSNYGIPGKTALFSIEDGKAIYRGSCDKHDVDFVHERDASASAKSAPQRDMAEEFIRDQLEHNGGEMRTSDLNSAAGAAGISGSTLKHAKAELKKSGLIDYRNSGYAEGKTHFTYLVGQPS